MRCLIWSRRINHEKTTVWNFSLDIGRNRLRGDKKNVNGDGIFAVARSLTRQLTLDYTCVHVWCIFLSNVLSFIVCFSFLFFLYLSWLSLVTSFLILDSPFLCTFDSIFFNPYLSDFFTDVIVVNQGVRVKLPDFLLACVSLSRFRIFSRTGGCLGSRDRDQLQPALTTLTN